MTPQITATELHQKLTDKTPVLLLDVRTTGEFAKNKIAGAINLPLDQIEEKLESELPDKNKLVVVYCVSGARSEAAVEYMISRGYKNVFNLESGLMMWRLKQYPLS